MSSIDCIKLGWTTAVFSQLFVTSLPSWSNTCKSWRVYVAGRVVSLSAGSRISVEFVFIPFKCLKDETPGFFAVEYGKIKDFQKLCHEFPANADEWDNLSPSYELTVTKYFKYSQNNEKTFRFLVLLNPTYKPFQHRFTTVAAGSEAMTTLGSLVKKWGGFAERIAYASQFMGVAKALVGDDLHTF